jgi:hypothetical protein
MFGAPLGASESGVLTDALWPSKHGRGSMSGFSDETDAPAFVQQPWARRRLSTWFRWQVGVLQARCSLLRATYIQTRGQLTASNLRPTVRSACFGLHRRRACCFVAQGRWCAERPGRVLAVCALAVVLTALGLLRLRVETDPQRLWVGADSQALAEKRHFEVGWLDSVDGPGRQGVTSGLSRPRQWHAWYCRECESACVAR